MVSLGQQQQRQHYPTGRALQQLARQLDDAVAFCQGCLEQHAGNVEKVTSHVDAACRRALWRQLLEAQFRASGRDRHLFANLRADVEDLAACQRTVKEMGIMKEKGEELLEGDKQGGGDGQATETGEKIS